MLNPFQPIAGASRVMALTSVASSITAPPTATQVLFYNDSSAAAPVDCFVEAGSTTAVVPVGAGVGGVCVPVGAVMVLSCNPNASISAVVASGAATLRISFGQGQ